MMDFIVNYQKLPDIEVTGSFLLKNAKTIFYLYYSDGSSFRKETPILKDNCYKYSFNLNENRSNFENGKKHITSIVIEHSVFYEGQTIQRIIQKFLVNYPSMTIASFAWGGENLSNPAIARFNISPQQHPLIELVKQSRESIELSLNCFFIDITKVFFDLSKKISNTAKPAEKKWNIFTDYYNICVAEWSWKLRAYLFTGEGGPLIWLVSVPNTYLTFKDITPTYFFKPPGSTKYGYEQNSEAGIKNRGHFTGHPNGLAVALYYLSKPMDEKNEPTILNKLAIDSENKYKSSNFKFLRDKLSAINTELSGNPTPKSLSLIHLDDIEIPYGLAESAIKAGKNQLIIFPLSNAGLFPSLYSTKNLYELSEKLIQYIYATPICDVFNKVNTTKFPEVKNLIISSFSLAAEYSIPIMNNNSKKIDKLILLEPKLSPKDKLERYLRMLTSDTNKKIKIFCIGASSGFTLLEKLRVLQIPVTIFLPPIDSYNEKVYNKYWDIKNNPQKYENYDYQNNDIYKWFEHLMKRLEKPIEDKSIQQLSAKLFNDNDKIINNIKSYSKKPIYKNGENFLTINQFWANECMHHICMSCGQIFDYDKQTGETKYKTFFQEALEM